MSSRSIAAFKGLSSARSRLQRIADGLRMAAGGAVVTACAATVREHVEHIARDKYGKHEATGALLSSTVATASGGLVQLTRAGYSRFHRWDPLRRGTMPPFIVTWASKVFSTALLECVRGNPAFVRTAAAIGLSDAEDVESESTKKAAKKAARRKRG